MNQHILLVCPWAGLPGHYWPNVAATADALDRIDIGVEVLAPGVPPPIRRGKHVSVNSMNRTARIGARLTRFRSAWLTLACSIQTLRLASGTRYSAIHFINGQQVAVAFVALIVRHSVVINNVYGFPAPRDAQKKSRFALGLGLRFRDLIVRWVVRTGRLWIVVETPQLVRAYQPVYGKHVVEIPYSLSPPDVMIDRESARDQLNLPRSRFIFLIFGTHREGKDYATVVRALGQVSERAIVFFAGKLISSNDPHQHAASLPRDRTAFLDGFVTDRQMALCFTAADVVIVPYEENFERGSGVLMEASRYHRPVLASASGHLRAYIEQNRVGLVYRTGDADDLALKMTDLMRANRIESFAGAIAEAADRHSWANSVHSYVALYESRN